MYAVSFRLIYLIYVNMVKGELTYLLLNISMTLSFSTNLMFINVELLFCIIYTPQEKIDWLSRI